MRILHVITRMILGGAQENTLLSVLGQMEKPGLEVALATGPTTGPEGSLIPLARERGVKIIEIPELIRAVSPRHDLAAYYKLKALFQEWKPDIVHTHSSKAGILARLAASAAKIPGIVHTIHGLPFHPYQSKLRNAAYIMAERWAARHCHKIVSVCDAMTSQALAAGVGSPQQYATVYSGMEIDQFLRRDWDRAELRRRYLLPPDAFVIGKVARLFELKGHEYLFQSFAQIKDSFPQAHLFLVGDGSWREKLECEARALGLAGCITFAGLVPRDDVPAAIAAMDMVAHCSLREGLARVLPQALLSQKPTASFDVDGAREVVINNQTGYLTAPCDTAALAAAIASAIESPAQAAALAAEGCRRCREMFDWRKMAEKLIAIYQELLK